MRRLFALLIFCCGLPLVAAAPRVTPAPHPSPRAIATPRVTPTPLLDLSSLQPTLLIYPFDATTDLNGKAGTQVANLFAREIKQAGRVNVLPVPTNVPRTSYLTNARTQKADYYITGYVTPIGDSASIVVQLVSVQSGVIAFAQTNQVSTINDANSLALTFHDAILQLSGNQVNVSTTESATTAPSAAPTNGASFNLSHLFSHHTTAAAHVATPEPSTRPSRGIILVSVRGAASVPQTDLHRATQLLEHDLASHFSLRNGGAAPASLATAADSICGADRNNTIATGNLVQERIGGLRPHTKSTFTLEIWTCFGDVLYQTSESDLDVAKAISSAVSDYVTAHPSN